jgi:hypothetical protein
MTVRLFAGEHLGVKGDSLTINRGTAGVAVYRACRYSGTSGHRIDVAQVGTFPPSRTPRRSATVTSESLESTTIRNCSRTCPAFGARMMQSAILFDASF